MNEHWKPVSGYEGRYEVSDFGRVKSLPKTVVTVAYTRHTVERILKPSPDGKGYLMVWLYKDDIRHSHKVARLVAEAFIPNPENKPQIDHINTIKTDNRVENLRWVTGKENIHNPITYKKNADSKRGSLNGKARKISQYTMSGDIIRQWNCIADVKRELGFGHSHIIQCCRGYRSNAYGYVWRYA